MKTNISTLMAIIKYWLNNGKTITALITGVIITALQVFGVADLTTDQVELIAAAVAAGSLGIIGIIHKIIKFINDSKSASDN